jgi:hypothetical protein
MSEPVLPVSVDPSDYSPEARARAIAPLLAAGLFRLRRPVIAPTSPPVPGAENPSESDANQLALVGEQSVTVSPVN